jgi:hypothetical protein
MFDLDTIRSDMPPRWFSPALALGPLILCLLCSPAAWAIKPYTLVEDGYPDPVGQLELENTFELNFHTREDSGFKELAVEHELEYQFTEQFNLRIKGAYVYEDSKENTGLHFDAAGVEAQYYFTNSNVDPLGISVIVAAEAGEQTLNFESFLVLQKDWAKWAVTYNIGLATEIDGVFTDHGGGTTTTGTITNALGAVYNVSNTVRAGAEIAAESSYANWSHYDGTTVFAGPVINWVPNSKLWMTAGFSFQLTDTADEPDYRFTVIVGYFF